MSKAALKTFFADVATASPIPVMIYNYPGAAGGIDIDSDTIVEIARENPNICGVKLTCGAVGKLTRITAGTQTSALSKFPRAAAVAPEFVTLGGFADFLLPTVGAGRAHGAIMGLANIFPRSIVKLMSLALKEQSDEITKEEKQEALRLQDLCAGADAAFAKAGIAGTKWWLKQHNGVPNARVRRPLLETSEEAGKALIADPAIAAFWEVEQALAK
jgi:dihydrodipicolinate synthase/N-acetylneuraminate lyase